MNINIPTEVLEKFGEEVIISRLNSIVEEFVARLATEKKRELGEKIFNYRDIPEVVVALDKIDSLEAVDNTQTDVPVADIITP